MKPYYEHAGIQIFHGDCREVLPQFEGTPIQCVVTSPPYWGLRDYGNERQMGLERTPAEYVSGMTGVFAAVRSVLLEDGTLWLNLGDSYHNGDKGGYAKDRVTAEDSMQRSNIGANFIGAPNRQPIDGLKPKDLVGIPWMVAFALRSEGWYLRSDIIWAKPNPMPESVTDRPTKAHEYIFLMSKSERYCYNAEAIQEEAVSGDPRKPYAPGQVDARGNGHDRGGGKRRKSVERGGFNGKTNSMPGREAFRAIEDWRNKRTVWTVTTKAYPEAHFATFPPDLIKPCILAGCPHGAITLDPFAGAGTTLLVAKQNGCRAIGIEIEEKYCEIAAERLSQEVLQFTEGI